MYTSQRCPECGHTDKGSRKTQANLRGLNCGYENNADVVGLLISINILWRSGRSSKMASGRTQAQAPPMNREPTEETKRGLSLLIQ
jgi:putative transposase